MFTSSTSSSSKPESDRLTKGFSKATMLLTGAGPPVHKQLKTSIQECNEDKAIAIYMSKEGNKIHPSKPFPTKKVGGPQDTPLHSTARFGLAKLFKLFLEYGGNPSTPNAKSENCAHTVCSASTFPTKRLEILDMIFDWRGRLGASSGDSLHHPINVNGNNHNLIDFVPIDALDIDGNTALHLAAQYGLLICIERLIERGASLEIMNSQDLSCCEMADRGNFPQIGTMLELAWLFQPVDNLPLQLSQTFHKFSSISNGGMSEDVGRVVVDSRSITLSDVIEFINDAIKYIADEFDETAARAEVLLHCSHWDVVKLKKELTANANRFLQLAKLKPRVYPVGFQKRVRINVGIPVEDVYLDPSYATISSFAVIQEDGKKKFFSFQQIDNNNGNGGKVGVFPVDYDPAYRYIDQPASNDGASGPSSAVVPVHVQKRKSDALCQMCQEPMYERVGIQHFIQNTCIEPTKREIVCSSGHRYCFGCWSESLHKYFDNAANNNAVISGLPCPHPECGEVLDLQWAPIFFQKEEQVNRLLAQRQRKVIDHLNLKWCPVPNCGLLIKVCGLSSQQQVGQRSASPASGPPAITMDGNNAVSEYQYKGKRFQLDMNVIPKVAICGHGHSFCLQCFHEAHGPCSCMELASWQDLLRDATKQADLYKKSFNTNMVNDEDNDISILLSYPQAKQCRRCHAMVHKEDGCNEVICPGCSHKFCWTCMNDWSSFHTNNTRGGAVRYCNRASERGGDHTEAANEEKLEDASTKSRTGRIQKLKRIVHYYARFMAHFESRRLECEARINACERVLDGLHASADGEFPWLQGGSAANPWTDQTTEDEVVVRFYHSRKHSTGAMNNDISPMIEDYCLEKDEPIEFIQNAFEELEKARTLLQWTYPFSLFEFDEKLSANLNNVNNGSTVSPEVNAYRVKAIELRPEFELLQAALEYETEMLSNLIAKRRFRGTKQHISVQATTVTTKRVDLEQLVMYFYSFKVAAAVPAPAVTIPSIQMDEDGIPLVADADISLSDDETEPKPTKAPTPPPEEAPKVNGLERKKTFSKITAEDIVVSEEELLPLKQKVQAAKALFKAGSQLNILLEQVRLDDPVKKKKKKKKQRVQSLYIKQDSGSEDETETPSQYESHESPSVEESKAISSPPSYNPTPLSPIPEPPIESPINTEPVIEQRFIGAKKDPDEEALEHAILISKQEEEFGVNMYDALTPEDEPVIEEYMIQGFTREEAILIIFEHKVGKVSILADQPITPAMPTLHKLPSNMPSSQAHLVGEEDEGEIEYLMTRGYTREQAIEVILHKRNRQQQQQQGGSHNSSGHNLHQGQCAQQQVYSPPPPPSRPVVPRIAVNAPPSNNNNTLPYTQSVNGYNSVDSYGQQSTSTYVRNSTDMSYMDERTAIESLLARGYTLEQATSVYRSSLANNSNNTTALQPLMINTVADEHAISRHNQQMAADIYGGNQEEMEIAELMARGFTREQAYQILQQSIGGSSASSNRGSVNRKLNRTTSNVTAAAASSASRPGLSRGASMQGSAQGFGNDDDVQRLIAQGYTREQATQVLLHTATANVNQNNASMPNMMSSRSKSSKAFAQDDHLQTDSMSQGSRSIYRASGMVNPSDEMDDFEMAGDLQQAYQSGQQQLYEPDLYQGGAMASAANYAPSISASQYYEQQPTMATDPYMMAPNGNTSYYKSPVEYSRLIAQQEAEFGINMYDSVVPADEPEINRLMSMGYSHDDAVLLIFQQRYQGGMQQSVAPQSIVQPQSQMMSVPVPNPSPMPIVPSMHSQQQLASSMSNIDLYNNQNAFIQQQQHNAYNNMVAPPPPAYDPYMTAQSAAYSGAQGYPSNVYQQYPAGSQQMMYGTGMEQYDVQMQQQMQQQSQYGYPYPSMAEQQQVQQQPQQTVYHTTMGYYTQHGMMDDSQAALQAAQSHSSHHGASSSTVRSPTNASTGGQKKKVFRGASLFGMSPSNQAQKSFNNGSSSNGQQYYSEEDALSRAIRISEEEARQRNQATAAQYYQGQSGPFQQSPPPLQQQKSMTTKKSSGLFSSNASQAPSTTPTASKMTRSTSAIDPATGKVKYKTSDVKQLEKMGFSKDQAVQALIESQGDVNMAAEMLATSYYHVR